MELGLPAVDEVRATVQRGRVLATAGPVWKSPLVLGLLAAFVVSVAGLVLCSVVAWGHGWLTRQAALVRQPLSPAEATERQIDERLAAIEAQHRVDHAIAQQRLAESEAKLAVAQHLAEAEAAEAAAKNELSQLTGPRLLERHLSERAGSGGLRPVSGSRRAGASGSQGSRPAPAPRPLRPATMAGSTGLCSTSMIWTAAPASTQIVLVLDRCNRSRWASSK